MTKLECSHIDLVEDFHLSMELDDEQVTKISSISSQKDIEFYFKKLFSSIEFKEKIKKTSNIDVDIQHKENSDESEFCNAYKTILQFLEGNSNNRILIVTPESFGANPNEYYLIWRNLYSDNIEDDWDEDYTIKIYSDKNIFHNDLIKNHSILSKKEVAEADDMDWD
jgi:hypothetical protein